MELERFSSVSKQILTLAQAEARMMRHSYVGSLHLFCAFCKINDAEIAELFSRYRINPEIRREMRAIVGPGKMPHKEATEQFSPRVRDIFNRADQLSVWNHDDEIRPIHLFYAFLLAGEGVAINILLDKNINIDGIKDELSKNIISCPPDDANPSEGISTPFLNKYGRDLTRMARKGALPAIIGRKSEITRIVQILTMKKKNNPLLLGDAGVGKTAIVEGLAQRLLDDSVHPALKKMRIVEVNVAALIAGTKYRGEFEERFLKILEEATQDTGVVLFIDEIHMLIGAGAAGGSIDAGNMMKPKLARGDIRCIGATTIDEYRKYIEKDPAMERRFQPVIVEEPSQNECLALLKALKGGYEKHYDLHIDDDALSAAVEMSSRYIRDRKLPDKALDVIDQAAAKKRLKSLSHIEAKKISTPNLSREDVAIIISEWTGIPVISLTRDEAQKLLDMESFLRQRVVGQDDIIAEVAHTIRMAKTGISNPNRPIGVFLFAGPSGVGKTELAKALAEFLFDDSKRLIRFDMSEYHEPHSISRLIGAPPGYVGHDQEGQLSQHIRNHPYSVLLLDEFEKANSQIFTLFLQVFDEGRLTDARGRLLDFTNAVIIMTSNFSSKILELDGNVPENGADAVSEKNDLALNMKEFKNALSRAYSPEFIGRIDKILIFNELKNDNIRPIIDKIIDQVQERLSSRQIRLQLGDSVYDLLIEQGISPQYGARELQRVVQKLLLEPLSEILLKKTLKPGSELILEMKNRRITFKVKE